ncbi:MAG: hypothetical protein OXQ92_09030 [Boseongicola sp.]|nr:hypothetical protein [Boseongicola sp.]
MSLGAVAIGLPVAVLGSLWMNLFHGFNAVETIGAYMALGILTTSLGLSMLALAAYAPRR